MLHQEIKFKTNIHCGGCLNRVTPILNQMEAIKEWDVDLEHPDKILIIQSDSARPEEIIGRLAEIGYQAEVMEL